MYYKLEKGNPTFKKLDAIWDKIQECNIKSADLVKELGFKEFAVSRRHVAGGISAIYSKEKIEGFKRVGKPHQYLIYPRANNKDVISKIEALPTVSYHEYNETIGFKEQFQRLNYLKRFGTKKVNDLYLIEVSTNADYTPTDDMVEITFTEYKRLSELKNK